MTGRPITAADVRAAMDAEYAHDASVADYLNRIARAAPERGDDEPLCCTCDYSGLPGEPHKRFCEKEYGPHAECTTRIEWLEEQLAAGSLPAMPPEVTWALEWFEQYPELMHARHAATVVRWAMSLPAPPPDDVTAHVEWATVGTDEDGDEGIETFESKDQAVAAAERWRRRGMTNVYVERHDVSTTRTVVEGEPQAAEPPRFERGFYRLARNLSVKFTGDYRRVRMVAVQDQSDDDVTVWTPGHGEAVVSAAALAAAGAELVKEGDR